MPQLRASAVAYSFLELREWRNRLIVRDVLSQPGVTMLDLAEQTNRVVIGLKSEQYRGPLLRFAIQAGVPAQAMDFEVTGALISTQGSLPTLRSTVRPLEGGLQIRRQVSATTEAVCTLGATGYMDETDTLPIFITASHCGPRRNTTDTVLWFQNANAPRTALDSSSALIGHEIADSAGFACQRNMICSYADLAVNALTTTNWAERVAKPFGGCAGTACDLTDYRIFTIDTLTPYYIIDEVHPNQFVVEENVSKIGATTGWTGGVVSRTCIHVTQDNAYVYLCQVEMTDTPSDGGDSGAPVLVNPSNPREDPTAMLGGIVIAKAKVKGKDVAYFTPWPSIALQYPKLRLF